MGINENLYKKPYIYRYKSELMRTEKEMIIYENKWKLMQIIINL